MQKIQGLRTQENDKFLNFWKIVQSEAEKQNSVFFLDCGDGNEMTTDEFNAEDLFGWLVPNNKVSNFEALFDNFLDEDINDMFDDCYKSVTWNFNNGTLSVKIA